MPHRSSSPERKPALSAPAPSALSSDSDTKPDLTPKTSKTKVKRGGRIDAADPAALASAVIQRGVATALADIDAVSAETGLTAQQIRSQLAGNRQNLRKAMESAAGGL